MVSAYSIGTSKRSNSFFHELPTKFPVKTRHRAKKPLPVHPRPWSLRSREEIQNHASFLAVFTKNLAILTISL